MEKAVLNFFNKNPMNWTQYSAKQISLFGGPDVNQLLLDNMVSKGLLTVDVYDFGKYYRLVV